MNSTAIKIKLIEKGMNQKQFAKEMGITEGSVCHYMNGRNNPNIETLKKMCAVLGCKAEEIW